MLIVVLPSTAGAIGRLGASTHLGTAGASLLLVAAIGAVVCGGAALIARRSSDPADTRVGFLAALATGVLVLTFAGSSAIPGVGIVESFPFYLLAPVSAGIAAGLLAPRFFPKEEGFALPGALLSGTVGVLLGADVLREPPLYGHGPAGLYAIGGAGVLDLVYLSGLLALTSAYLTHAVYERSWMPIGPPLAPVPPLAQRQLRDAFRSGVGGDLAGSLERSASAARTAAAQARRLFGLSTPAEERPWQDLPVPGWIVSDQANLDRVAGSGTTDPREGYRAWLTARWLVLVGRDLSLRRFASVPQRLVAFAIDLLLVTAPALAVFAVIARATPGGFGAVASSVPFNVAIVGFVAVALLYFALAEAYAGTTLGKSTVGIAVRDRALRRPDGLRTLVRNLPLAPILTMVGLGGAIALAIIVKGTGPAGTSVLGVGVPSGLFAGFGIIAFVVGGVGLLGSFGILCMALTYERQRIGDLWAGTWVVRDATEAPPSAEAAEPPPPSPPPATDPSG
ncbi:MAG: RDD family protein [Thermoplasmata archaeon]